MNKQSKKLLIIDALNFFLRSYVVNPTLTKNGDPAGGVVGFLKSLQKVSREVNPDQIIICWDGKGGSTKRKKINKNYKDGRSPVRLNRDIRTLSENEEFKNKIWQHTRIIEYLNELPVIQIMLDDAEADDIVSYVNSYKTYQDWYKVIVSSDKDFFQLCDNKTILHRPVQKLWLTKKSIVELYGVSPINFALARALEGDSSDNLPGVPRLALKTIAKKFPSMALDVTVTVKDLYRLCENVEQKLKIHENILSHKDRIATNYKLMQLYAPMLSAQNKARIRFILDNANLKDYSMTNLNVMMLNDGIETISLSDLHVTCKRIIANNL